MPSHTEALPLQLANQHPQGEAAGGGARQQRTWFVGRRDSRITASWVRVRGNRAFVSGHGALTPDGSPGGPFGKVPTEVSLEEAQASARDTALSVLGSLK